MTNRARAIEFLKTDGADSAWYIANALGVGITGLNKALRTANKHDQLRFVLVDSGSFHNFRHRKTKLWYHPDNPPDELDVNEFDRLVNLLGLDGVYYLDVDKHWATDRPMPSPDLYRP